MILKCKVCGATLEYNSNMKLIFCQFCGNSYLPQEIIESKQSIANSASVESLLKRIDSFLEDGAFEKALEYIDRVLDIDPECSQAYAKRICCKYKLRHEKDIRYLDRCIYYDKDWQRALLYSQNTPYYKEIEQQINKRILYLFACRCQMGFQIGESVKFGRYAMNCDGTDVKPIEWVVIDINDDELLLISKYALDLQTFNSNRQKTNKWQYSEIREWLNSYFYSFAFSDTEKQFIRTYVHNNEYPEMFDNIHENNRHESDGYNDEDRVFLLSVAEFEKYLGWEEWLRCIPTPFASSEYKSFYCDWWLRTRKDPAVANYVSGSNNVKMDFTSSKQYIRPAIWLKIPNESESEKLYNEQEKSGNEIEARRNAKTFYELTNIDELFLDRHEGSQSDQEIFESEVFDRVFLDLETIKSFFPENIVVVVETEEFIFYRYDDGKYHTCLLRQSRDKPTNLRYFGNCTTDCILFHDMLFMSPISTLSSPSNKIIARNINTGKDQLFNWLSPYTNFIVVAHSGHFFGQDSVIKMQIENEKLVIYVNRKMIKPIDCEMDQKNNNMINDPYNKDMQYRIIVSYENGTFISSKHFPM